MRASLFKKKNNYGFDLQKHLDTHPIFSGSLLTRFNETKTIDHLDKQFNCYHINCFVLAQSNIKPLVYVLMSSFNNSDYELSAILSEKIHIELGSKDKKGLLAQVESGFNAYAEFLNCKQFSLEDAGRTENAINQYKRFTNFQHTAFTTSSYLSQKAMIVAQEYVVAELFIAGYQYFIEPNQNCFDSESSAKIQPYYDTMTKAGYTNIRQQLLAHLSKSCESEGDYLKVVSSINHYLDEFNRLFDLLDLRLSRYDSAITDSVVSLHA